MAVVATRRRGRSVAETVAGGSALTDSYFDIWPGPAGWAEISWYPAESVPRAQPSVKPLRIYVRVAADKQTSSLRIVELRVHEPSQESLRGLPLGRIEIAANTQLVQAYLHRSLDVEEPVNVADYFRLARRKRHETPRFVLKRPQTRRLPDAFYKDVARAYRDATERGLNPRKTLAMTLARQPTQLHAGSASLADAAFCRRRAGKSERPNGERLDREALTADGKTRWRVRFRLGGRETRKQFGGAFKTRREAALRNAMGQRPACLAHGSRLASA